jgi:predicted SAM-dependent methyltransferase
MPFKDNTFEEIHSVHVLEHLPRDKWPIMLSEIFRVLQEGGTFIVEVPDFEGQCKAFLKALNGGNTETIHEARTAIFGKTERLGMGHQYGFDKLNLEKALKTIGFTSTEFISDHEKMISSHYRAGPVLTFRCTKTSYRPPKDVRDMKFNDLREAVIK